MNFNEKIISSFLDYLWLSFGVSENTLMSYRSDLFIFSAWLKKNLDTVTNEEIKDYFRDRKKDNLSADFIGRGGAWLDTGSINDFYKTSAFVEAIENRQGLKIACIEEIALNNKWIGKKEIYESIKFYGKCNYSEYLKKLI